LGVWFLLDLGADWSIPGSRLLVAQMMVTVGLGGIAINAFFLYQLQQILRPRVDVAFMASPAISSKQFLSKMTGKLLVTDIYETWIHFRVINVGVHHLNKLVVSFILPGGWDAATVYPQAGGGSWHLLRLPDGNDEKADITYPLACNWDGSHNRLTFEPTDDPSETGPGASAIYSLRVVTRLGIDQIQVLVNSGSTAGASLHKRTVSVQHNP
jgi:hypothetical protein